MSGNSFEPAVRRESSTAKMVQVVYGLYAINLVLPGPFALGGVIVAYLAREETRGTWLQSHVTWQIRTFWLSLLYLLIGLVTLPILVGVVILCLLWLWQLVRTAMGWSAFAKELPVSNPYSWMF